MAGASGLSSTMQCTVLSPTTRGKAAVAHVGPTWTRHQYRPAVCRAAAEGGSDPGGMYVPVTPPPATRVAGSSANLTGSAEMSKSADTEKYANTWLMESPMIPALVSVVAGPAAYRVTTGPGLTVMSRTRTVPPCPCTPRVVDTVRGTTALPVRSGVTARPTPMTSGT